MAKKKRAKKKAGKKRGPAPLILKIEGPWEEAVARAMRAGKPKAKRRTLARAS